MPRSCGIQSDSRIGMAGGKRDRFCPISRAAEASRRYLHGPALLIRRGNPDFSLASRPLH